MAVEENGTARFASPAVGGIKLRTLLILRAHKADAETLAVFDRYAGLRDVDLVLCCDERGGPVDMGGRAKVGYDDAVLTGLGLFPHPRCGWRCGDYAYYVTRAARPDYDVYWLTEPDVLFNTADLQALFESLNATDADLLAARVGPRDARWKWSVMMQGRYADVFGCIFPVTRLTGQAIDHLHAARRAAWESNCEVVPDDWPNDEVFVVTELMNHGFACRDLSEQTPACATHESIRTAVPYDRTALLSREPDGLIYHPVRDLGAWLQARANWAAELGRRGRDRTDALGAAQVRKLLGMASGALEQPALQDAAFFPLMLARGKAPASTAGALPVPLQGQADYQERAARLLARHFGHRRQDQVVATGYRLRAAADCWASLPAPDDFARSDAAPLNMLPGEYALPYAFDAEERTMLYTVHPQPQAVLSAPSALLEQRRQACIGCVVEWRHLARPEADLTAVLLALPTAEIKTGARALTARGLRPIVAPPALLQLAADGPMLRRLQEDWRVALIHAALMPAARWDGWVFVVPLQVVEIADLLTDACPAVRVAFEASGV